MTLSIPTRLSTPAPVDRATVVKATSQPANSLLMALNNTRPLPSLGLIDVNLHRSQVLQNPGARIAQVYFPTTSVLSLTSNLESGHATEIASIGREGMTGLMELWFGGSPPARLSVQIPGHAYAMKLEAYKLALLEDAPFRSSLRAFEHYLMTQIVQSATCYRYHTARQQCARWLLVNSERTGCPGLPVTHDTLADLLGVFRPTVTVALRELQSQGLLKLQRGLVTIIDECGLAAEACSCYAGFSGFLNSSRGPANARGPQGANNQN